MSDSDFSLIDRHRPGIPASVGSSLVLFAASRGIPIERLSRAIGIDPAKLIDPDARVPQDLLYWVLKLLGENTAGEPVTILASRALIPISLFGTVGRLVSRAPDLRTALELAIANSDLFNEQVRLELQETPSESMLSIKHPHDKLDHRLEPELIVMVAVRFIHEHFGKGVVSRIQFRHQVVGQVESYERALGIPVRFGAECNAFVVHTPALARVNQRMHPMQRALLEQRLAEHRQKLGMGGTSYIDEVRAAFAKNMARGDYSMAGLVATLGTSQRSLQRRLRAFGTNAAALVDEGRHEAALQMLYDENITIDEISDRLGFSSERGFRRAFQRWTGMTPARARRAIRDEPNSC